MLDDANGRADVFVAVGNDQRQLSPVPSGDVAAGSWSPSIAGDPGPLRVAFETSLAAQSSTVQVAVHTASTGQTRIASVTPAGRPGDRESRRPSLAADGASVAFGTEADLGAGSGGDHADVVVRDLAAGRTALVSAPAAGPLPEDLSAVVLGQRGGQLSPDARFATFTVEHDGLGAAGPLGHVHLRDARAGRTTLVDRADGPGGAPSAGAHSGSAAADGRIVAFVTPSRLVAADANGRDDVYVRDTVAGTTRLVSRTPVGAAGNGPSADPAVSADGRRVAFQTQASDLGGGAGAGAPRVRRRPRHGRAAAGEPRGRSGRRGPTSRRSTRTAPASPSPRPPRTSTRATRTPCWTSSSAISSRGRRRSPAAVPTAAR